MNLFDPVRIGTLEAKNHFLRSATYEGAATEDGRPTDKSSPYTKIWRAAASAPF